MENITKADMYITCPRKGKQHQKSVEVCRVCQHAKDCEAYQDYVQPGLPWGRKQRV